MRSFNWKDIAERVLEEGLCWRVKQLTTKIGGRECMRSRDLGMAVSDGGATATEFGCDPCMAVHQK